MAIRLRSRASHGQAQNWPSHFTLPVNLNPPFSHYVQLIFFAHVELTYLPKKLYKKSHHEAGSLMTHTGLKVKVTSVLVIQVPP